MSICIFCKGSPSQNDYSINEKSCSQLLLFAGSSDTTITVWDLSDFLEGPYSPAPLISVHDDSSLTPSNTSDISSFHVKVPLLCVSFEPHQGDVLTLALHRNDDGLGKLTYLKISKNEIFFIVLTVIAY